MKLLGDLQKKSYLGWLTVFFGPVADPFQVFVQ